ncbi:ADP-ribosylation factor-like protein 16 [Lineus longissimus]|uniref:ADP-ribosylation factor-like protein 16 n=1 Tax=Lineus longissimus TaxID=88925 RepID=UPI002B4DCB6C
MALLLGSPGVGKTLLSKRLQTCSAKGNDGMDVPLVTSATVGLNLIDVNIGRKQEVTITEVGGCMAPIWPKYYKETKRLMFVIDMSNRMQISASCIQLLGLLDSDQLQDAAFLLIFNKMDMPNAMNRCEFGAIVRLEEIIQNAVQKVTVVEVSAKEGRGLQDIIKWLQDT